MRRRLVHNKAYELVSRYSASLQSDAYILSLMPNFESEILRIYLDKRIGPFSTAERDVLRVLAIQRLRALMGQGRCFNVDETWHCTDARIIAAKLKPITL